jgi:hypothetical protein
MKRAFEFNLDACIGEYTKRPATVAPPPAPVAAVAPPPASPEPKPEPEPEPEPEPDRVPEAPEAQSAAQKMLHELINGPPPLLTPLAVLQPQPQPQAQPQPPSLPVCTPEAPPDPHRHRHAGILREFGGVREWLKTRDAHDAAGASTA